MIFPVSVSMSVFERTIEIYGETVRGIDRWIEHSTQGKTDSNGVVNHSEKEERKEGRKEGRKFCYLYLQCTSSNITHSMSRMVSEPLYNIERRISTKGVKRGGKVREETRVRYREEKIRKEENKIKR